MQSRQWMNHGCFRRTRRGITALWIFAVAASTGSLKSDTYTWSTGTSGSAVDGSGTWNTTTANWVGAGDAHTTWNNGDTAAFGAGGTAGTVTVASAGISIGGLTFNSGVTGTYLLSGGPLTLTGTPVFTANANATLGVLLTGEKGFTKAGTGTLSFSNAENTFTGDVQISAGTVTCTSMNQGGTNSVLGRANLPRMITVGNGATLQFNAHDTFGNDGKNPAVTLAVKNGGTIKNNNTFTTFGSLSLEDGTVTSSGGAATAFQAYQLRGTVTAGGNSAINTTGGNYNGVHVFDTPFAVTGGTLTVSAQLINRPSPTVPGGIVSGFIKSGDGKMILAADNSFGGNVTVSNGVLQVGNGGASGTLGTGAGAVNLVAAESSLVFNRSGSTAVSGPISGNGALVKLGTGLVTLAGANSYAGGTAISNGVLAVLSTNALPGYATPGRVTLAGGAGLSVGVGAWSNDTITALIDTGIYGSDTIFGFDTTAGNYVYNNQFDLPSVAGLVKTGPNALTLLSGTPITMGVTALGGILQADFGAGIPAMTNVTLTGASLSSASGTITASLGSGMGQITIAPGTASGFSAVNVPLTVDLGYGATLISGATVTWGSSIFNPGPLVLNDIGANTNLNFVNAIDLNGATRTVNVNATAADAAAEISGVISGGGTAGLIKGGAGKLVLSAANTLSGRTTINAGTLALSGGNNRLNTSGLVTLNSGALDMGGYVQTLAAGNFTFAGGMIQNGSVSLSNTSWSPSGMANVTIGVGGGLTGSNRLLLNSGQTLTLVSGAGSVCFGGDTGGSANYIGVDNASTNTIIVNGGSLDYTNSAAGAGYLRIAANSGPPVGTLTVNNGAVNVGHSMNMGARWSNGNDAACTGVATLNVNGGAVNVGTGTSTGTGGGTRGWLYMGNAHAGTVSRSTINLNGGTLSLIQLECGAYGTNTLNFNGGTLKARADNASFVNGARLVCNVDAGGAVIDTAGYKVGLAANLIGTSFLSRLVKRGAGTLTMSGSNTCNGVTSVEEGTLALSAGAVFPTHGATQLSAEALSSLKLRLDASDSSSLFTNSNGSGSITTSGQPVGYWGDLSGNGKHATQTTADNRPTYVTEVAEFNGRPVVQFDGVNDDITSALDINAANISNITVMMIFRQVTKPANSGLWGHDDGGWDRSQLLKFANGLQWGYSSEYPIATSANCVPVKGMDTNAVLIYTASLKNGVANGSHVYINGQSDSANGLPAFTSAEGSGRASFTLANISANNGYHGNIQIGEVLVFDTANDAIRLNAEAYLKDKWVALSGSVNLASDAVLDCGGVTQTVTTVTGTGTISNGTLTVIEPLSPGGNDIGTQKVSNIALNGTLLVNVTADGLCDRLVGTGNVSLSGLKLRIANPSLLNREKSYTVMTCAGTISGDFDSTNLPANWHVRYDRPAGLVTFYYAAPGTMIRVK